jgi:alcohol dehydrogenase
MKAAVFNGKDIEIKQVTKPEVSNSEVLIRVKAVGICGTDLAIINGDLPSPTPIILGHEFSGVVVKVGKNVDSKWIGKRVTSEINTNIDFNCYYCTRGIHTQCRSRKALGIDVNGALAEYITVESYLLHEIPESIPYEEATFVEPLAAAFQVFEMMDVDEDDTVIAIFGLGKLGLLICQVAILKGLKIIVVDGSEKKLALAKKFGANEIINRLKEKNVPKVIQNSTNGLGADIVVDATGSPDALKDVIASCRTRGKIHIKNTHGLSTLINITDIVVRELTLYSSRCGPFDKAIESMKSGAINVKDLISEEYFLDDIQDAIENYNKTRDHIKTIIKI